MIERLTVRNFILVDELELEFERGFTVLSGETGAGKSVLVGALRVLFGERAAADLIRSGAEEALVTGVFRPDRTDPEFHRWIADRGIEPEDEALFVRRVVRSNGRGPISIQGVPVSRSDLETFAGYCIDLHSQHQHQSLFVEKNHRLLVDRFGGLEERVATVGESVQRLAALRARLDGLDQQARDREREIEMLEFAIGEIHAASVEPNEERTLSEERERLVHFERLYEHVRSCLSVLNADDGGLVAQIKQAARELADAAGIDAALSDAAARIESAGYETEDVAFSTAAYAQELTFDPARLEEVEERITTLRRLKRKYGDSEEAVLQYADEAQAKLSDLSNVEENRERLTTEIRALESALTDAARTLHDRRAAVAAQLQGAISEVLRELAMPHAAFAVDVALKQSGSGALVIGASGADTVRFLFSANPGETERPLQKIASGGEISRVMLAIKSVLADSDRIETLVFDEIDAGIGGEVAVAIAGHMRDLSRATQLICITHLATIAVRADNHIVVEKQSSGGRTSIAVRPVTGEERELEIARMLSGDAGAEESRVHAQALLERSRGD